MTTIRITGGACGTGTGGYQDGAFTMPDGTVRGAETLARVEGPVSPETPPHWSGDLVRGLQGAMVSARTLPGPLSVAASAMEVGLDVFAGRPAAAVLRATFSDGAEAVIEADASFVALVERDRAVIRAALDRQPVLAPAPASAPNPDEAGAAERAMTSMFEYEKRNGRIRRVPSKEPTRKDPFGA